MLSNRLSMFGRHRLALGIAAALLAAPVPALALGEGIQCVPYARQLSGIQIYGDAHTWWGQAAAKYQRGNAPQVGAVLAFRPHGRMRLGHVAAVSRIVDARTLLVSHSNWSTINGTRGHIEDNVKVVDVSPANDWSEVRVWYTPNNALGTTRWPTHGFIYSGEAPRGAPVMFADAGPAKQRAAGPNVVSPAKAQKGSRNLLAQVSGDWVNEAAAREQRQSFAPRQAPPPRQQAQPRTQPRAVAVAAASGLPAGYTPSTYARDTAHGPSSIDELLARY